MMVASGARPATPVLIPLITSPKADRHTAIHEAATDARHHPERSYPTYRIPTARKHGIDGRPCAHPSYPISPRRTTMLGDGGSG